MKTLFYTLAFVVLLCSVLFYAKEFIIPIILSFIFWYIIKETSRSIRNISIKNKRLPKGLCTFLALTIILCASVLIIQFITENGIVLTNQLPTYQTNLNYLIKELSIYTNINLTKLASGWSQKIELSNIISNILSTIYSLLSSSFIILIYTIFLLLEAPSIKRKIGKAHADPVRSKNVVILLKNIDATLSHYIKLKTIVSVVTAVISYAILEFILHIDFAFFWSLLILILNFIPTVGSVIATFFPTIFSLMQYGNFTIPLLTLAFVGGTQIVIGNIIEPNFVGNRLNISPLVVIIALSFWGMIWGVIGMLISVPITLAMIVFFDQFQRTKCIALFMQGQKNNRH